VTKAQIAFKALYVNWFHEETKWYMENFNIDNPEDIPTEDLEDCNYKNLRILYEYFFNTLR
tara:strand:- start:318 stop:500 length:183 start_codon:yes stop_codon:yes gene_type:complete